MADSRLLAQQHQLTDVQLVLKFDQDGTFVPIPLEGQSLGSG